MFRRLKVIGGSALAFAALVALAGRYVEPGAAAAQVQRRVEPRMAQKFDPVVVTKITLGNVAVQRGRFIEPVGSPPDAATPFLADEDWIQNLTIYLLNRTNQTIVYAALTLTFPETTDPATRFRAGFRLYLGRIPESVAFENGRPIGQRPDSQPILFKPGETMAIHLGDYIDQIKTRVEPVMPLTAMTTMNVNLATFFFGNGLRWDGPYKTLDPQTHVWQRMAPDYFPGDPDGRWPGRPGRIDQQ